MENSYGVKTNEVEKSFRILGHHSQEVELKRHLFSKTED